MNIETARATYASSQATEHVDVLIVGAGISGIGSAYHLRRDLPDTSFVILESQESFGGTWITHRYPGIRSDSDLHTFGYSFKPWAGPPIAAAQEILSYMGEVIAENDLEKHIRYGHRIETASWSSETKVWTMEAVKLGSGERVAFTANFLWMCQGYYRHSEGYTPEWPDMDKFKGRIVHPQLWPDDIALKDKRVVVIGSGATAATLIAIELAEQLRQLQVNEEWIHEIVRRKILFEQDAFTRRCVAEPEQVTKELIGQITAVLGPDYDVATHFTPKYRPWRQRIAFVPDADLFHGIKSGKASVVTDEIDRFMDKGILLKSGQELEADIIVTATGFNLCVLGDIAFTVDGQPLDFADTVTYRGMMFTGVPNMAWVFGYFRASWTLRTDLVAEFVCRLLRHMSETGARKVEVALRPEDHNMPLLSWIDPDNFNPGYMMRNMHLLPRRGDKPEWQHNQDYWAEKDQFPAIDLDDKAFVYE
jgi:cation diffusion facilitator CzcD-associated flavoprotein CzcO